jgi:acetyltransferase-like isoleucine patch superfamily enzyme
MTFIHPTAIIGENVAIEDNVYIGPYCIIGESPEWKGHEDDNHGVIIRNGTRITGHVTIDGGGLSPTIVGENCYIMKHAHIGHDAFIGSRVTISCGAKIGGHVIIRNDCNIGLNAVIHQKQTIPMGCMIGMGAVITKGLQMVSNSKYVGNPAKYLSQNIKK